MKAVIIGSGEISDYSYIGGVVRDSAASFIICCDGGAAHAKKMNITPDIIVGDLDSIDESTLKYYKKSGVKIDKYEPAKDFTDMEIGLDKAIQAGADEIIFLGATGDRMDHSISNIGLLYSCMKLGITGTVINDNNKISLLDKKTELTEKIGQTVSLLPFTERATGITTTGMQYPLYNEALEWGTTRGISNVTISENASVDLDSGILILIMPIRP